MAKVKIKLIPDPTFSATVSIPIPGDKTGDVTFTFKGRTRDEYREFVDGITGRTDLEVVMDIVSGWNLDEPFSSDNVAMLLNAYVAAGRAIIDKYFAELTNARLGN